MKSAQFDRQIVIQEPTESTDANGSVTETWATWKTVYASRLDVRGSEPMDREKVNAMLNVRFRIRYLSGVTTTMRVKDGSNYFDIGSITQSMKRQMFTDLMCVQRNA